MLLCFAIVEAGCGGEERIVDPALRVPFEPKPAGVPETVIDNVLYSLSNRDVDWFEDQLDAGYLYFYVDQEGNVQVTYTSSCEVEILGDAEGNLDSGLFAQYPVIDVELVLEGRYEGPSVTDMYSDFLGSGAGSYQDMVAFRGLMNFGLAERDSSNVALVQRSTLIVRKTTEDIWKLLRWVDEPVIDGDYEHWGALKADFVANSDACKTDSDGGL